MIYQEEAVPMCFEARNGVGESSLASKFRCSSAELSYEHPRQASDMELN